MRRGCRHWRRTRPDPVRPGLGKVGPHAVGASCEDRGTAPQRDPSGWCGVGFEPDKPSEVVAAGEAKGLPGAVLSQSSGEVVGDAAIECAAGAVGQQVDGVGVGAQRRQCHSHNYSF